MAVFIAMAAGLMAGDLTVDKITVHESATVYGKIESVARAPDGPAPTNGLIAYYSFSTNASPIPDDSGNGNSGTASGAAWISAGVTNGAYRFDGTNDYIDIGSSSVLKLTNTSFTIAMWLKQKEALAPGHSFKGMIGSARWAVPVRGYYIHTGSTDWGGDEEKKRIMFNYYDVDGGAGSIDAYGFFDSYDTWHHAVITYELDGDLTLYKNGVLMESAATTARMADYTASVYIGMGWNDSYNRVWGGDIDQVRIYQRALSDQEVLNLYCATQPSPFTNGCTVIFQEGIEFVAPLGDLSMGSYTNLP